MMASQDFIEHNSKRENVGATIRRLLQQNLRRHICGRAIDSACPVHGCTLVGSWQVLGYSKVENLYLSIRSKHDIFRLDVAVHDTVFVCRHQGLRALHRDPQKLLQVHRRLLYALAQVLPINKLHHQKDLALFLDHVINSRDMSMVEAGRAFGLFLEAAAI